MIMLETFHERNNASTFLRQKSYKANKSYAWLATHQPSNTQHKLNGIKITLSALQSSPKGMR